MRGTKEKRTAFWWKKAGALLLALVFVTALAGCNAPSAGVQNAGSEKLAAMQSDKGSQGNKTVSGSRDGKNKAVGGGETLEVHFLDVGQGDATLIRQGDHAMLIDGGDNDQGTTVQSYLKSQGITHLDYVIGTHPDSDHVGGLDVVLYKFSWDCVILPNLEKDTRTYQDVLRVIQDKNQKITYPAVGDAYDLGGAEFTVIAPVKEEYGENWNDYSVGIRLTFGENSFVFTGDAEEAAEADMLAEGMDLSADVFKAAHHGSETANTMAFLEEVQPEAVVISCGEGNSYGHPRAEAMNHFRSIGAKVYRTDEQGTIVASSDGSTITWNCSPSESWKAGEPAGGQNSTKSSESGSKEEESAVREQKGSSPEGQNTEYVLNTNTMKFHLSSCSSVDQMNEENRAYSSLSREELLDRGYEPCGRCKP